MQKPNFSGDFSVTSDIMRQESGVWPLLRYIFGVINCTLGQNEGINRHYSSNDTGGYSPSSLGLMLFLFVFPKFTVGLKPILNQHRLPIYILLALDTGQARTGSSHQGNQFAAPQRPLSVMVLLCLLV